MYLSNWIIFGRLPNIPGPVPQDKEDPLLENSNMGSEMRRPSRKIKEGDYSGAQWRPR